MNARADLLAQFGGELIRRRTELGRSLEEAARDAGIEPERLALAEEGAEPLGGDELDAVAAVYGIDVTALFGGHVTPLAYLAGA